MMRGEKRRGRDRGDIAVFRYFFTISGLPDGAGFRMFGPGHLLWLAAVAAAAVFCTVKYRNLSAAGRKKMQLVFCWSMVELDLFKDVYFMITGVFSWEFLPLHLCGMAIYISLFNVYRPGRVKRELLYSLCMPGAAVALIFPAWTSYPLWNVATLQCFLIHALLFIYPILLLSSGEIHPEARNLPLCLLFLLAVCPPVYGINRLLGTDFMFINYPLPAQPFLLFVRWFGNPGYIFGMLLMLLTVWGMLYLPLALIRRSRSRRRSNSGLTGPLHG